MANAIPSRVGSINAGADTKALFLKMASGEVLTAFTQTTEFMDKHIVRNISAGKSAQFPATGRTTAEYHTPGAEITGLTLKQAEKIITIDDLLISHVFISNYDEAMSHFEVRGEYSKQIGEALAQQFDTNVARVGILNARASAVVDGLPGGSTIVNASLRTDADALAAAHFTAAQTFDEKYVPDGDRESYLKPAQYYMLAQHKDVINKDWGGEGSYARGSVTMIANIPFVKTNNLPTTNVTTGPAKYQGDFSNTAALIQHRSAVGTVKLMDLAMEAEYDIRRQGHLMVGKYAIGHGGLRPECGIELAIA
nr:hypothetical protein [uncultured Cohaesibacter sp.]